MISLTTAAPAVSAAFFASLVEVVEAFTIVLAAGTLRSRAGGARIDRRRVGTAARAGSAAFASARHRRAAVVVRDGLATQGGIARGGSHCAPQ